MIDVINDRTFAYQKGIELFRGGFNWNLQFRWYAVPPDIVKGRANDPTMPIQYAFVHLDLCVCTKIHRLQE